MLYQLIFLRFIPFLFTSFLLARRRRTLSDAAFPLRQMVNLGSILESGCWINNRCHLYLHSPGRNVFFSSSHLILQTANSQVWRVKRLKSEEEAASVYTNYSWYCKTKLTDVPAYNNSSRNVVNKGWKVKVFPEALFRSKVTINRFSLKSYYSTW